MAKKVLVGCLALVGAVCVALVIVVSKDLDDDLKYDYSPIEDDDFYW